MRSHRARPLVRRARRATQASVGTLIAVATSLAAGGPATAQCQYEVMAIVPGEQVCPFDGYQQVILREINNHNVAVGTRDLCIGGPTRMVR